MRQIFQLPILLALCLMACSGTGDAGKSAATKPATAANSVRERVVIDWGNRAVRTAPDSSLSHPELMKNKRNCFIVVSKKDYYLYVYEAQAGGDTVMLARYDCALALKKGDKTRSGDMRTPHCSSPSKPFHISQIAAASDWRHDFGDGRGNIKSYGDWFLRLRLDGHPLVKNRSIGLHGSTNNRESVPGRASEGCIRLRDEDISDLRRNYAFVGMAVIIKPETMDDLPFERRAMQRQHVARKRHFTAAQVLTNEQIATATPAKK